MIGRYGNEEPFIKGKGNYTIWQKSQTGKLIGITKNVDIDIFRKNKGISDIMLAQ
jgi:lysozyme